VKFWLALGWMVFLALAVVGLFVTAIVTAIMRNSEVGWFLLVAFVGVVMTCWANYELNK
jgi:hypothetical protein